MKPAHRYIVTIHYREPTYELRTHPRAEPFRGSFAVEARDPAAAVASARERFRRYAALSGSGWVRTIVGVECRLEAEAVGHAPVSAL